MKWAPKDRSLFVGLVRLTLISNRIYGGSQTITLAGDEVGALIGSDSHVITPDFNGNKTIVSNKSENRQGYPNCALNVGGIQFADPSQTSTFTAKVIVELIGQASGSPSDPEDGSNPTSVHNTFETEATYY